MKTNLETLSNEEINRIAAEEIMSWFKDRLQPNNQLVYMQGKNPSVLVMDVKNWNPCDPNSNQVRQYLIPKVFNMEPAYLHYEVVMEMGDWYVQWSNPSEDWEIRVDVDFEDENINNENKAVVIACIKAIREIKGAG